jgi:hypothetical protein
VHTTASPTTILDIETTSQRPCALVHISWSSSRPRQGRKWQFSLSLVAVRVCHSLSQVSAISLRRSEGSIYVRCYVVGKLRIATTDLKAFGPYSAFPTGRRPRRARRTPARAGLVPKSDSSTGTTPNSGRLGQAAGPLDVLRLQFQAQSDLMAPGPALHGHHSAAAVGGYRRRGGGQQSVCLGELDQRAGRLPRMPINSRRCWRRWTRPRPALPRGRGHPRRPTRRSLRHHKPRPAPPHHLATTPSCNRRAKQRTVLTGGSGLASRSPRPRGKLLEPQPP